MGEHIVEVGFTGEASDALAELFDRLGVTVDRGATRLRIVGRTHATLHGIIGQCDALGLDLISVRELDT